MVIAVVMSVLGVCFSSHRCRAAGPAADGARAGRFIQQYEATVRPLEIDANRAAWTANITGKEEDFQRKEAAETKLALSLSNRESFAELKAIKQDGLNDPLLARQISILYLEYLGKQVDPDLLKAMSVTDNAIQRTFNVFRPKVDGIEITDNQVRRTLRESTNPIERRAAWEASKKVGSVVMKDLRTLVGMRNRAARKLGFANYHVMQLFLAEQDQGQILKLFDDLDRLTRAPYRAAKAEIDAALASTYGIAVSQLRPWHYHDPFFQEAPDTLGDLPESVYRPLDSVQVCRSFYDGIGLPVDGVLQHSDLYEKAGKNPHAFCTDIDRAGDVRVLANVVPGREWLSTMLHEVGHAVYSENVGPALPYVLHTDAHPLCTEGVAMMFERFAYNADWLRAMGARIARPQQFRTAAAKWQRNRLLVFSRYCQVMFRFEAALYERGELLGNPERDLGRLWWDLVEKYQEVKRPEGRSEPDFAAKYHIVGAPAYYHNYLLGEMFASQVHHALVRDVLPGTKASAAVYVGDQAAGAWLRQRVFLPGLTLNWSELTRHATGEPLNPKAFAEDIQTSP
jgi:peptidyl-dipeptidase A